MDVRDEPDLVVLDMSVPAEADVILSELVDAFRASRRSRHERHAAERRMAALGAVDGRPRDRHRPAARGQPHPLYPDMIYPFDYGHVPGHDCS